MSHKSVADLRLRTTSDAATLAVDVRRAFSAIVTGNVKESGIRAIRKHGPYKLQADEILVHALENLLKQFASQGRMKLHGEYKPCYEVIPL